MGECFQSQGTKKNSMLYNVGIKSELEEEPLLPFLDRGKWNSSFLTESVIKYAKTCLFLSSYYYFKSEWWA